MHYGTIFINMIITICGSQTFGKEMGKAQEYLRKKGFDVHTPEFLITEEEYSSKFSKEKLFEMKPIWTQNHFKKIASSDGVMIMNHEKKGIQGYFGSNTLMELSVAFYLGKKIFLMNPVNENHPHYEEIIGIDLIVLNGDLDKIKQ